MMQTVPSLVGTGTAIAAAASGLVFGHPTDSDADRPLARRVLHKRNASLDPSPNRHDRLSFPSAASRPATSHPHQAMTMAAEDVNNSTLPRPASRSRPPLSRYQRPQSSQFPSRRSSIKNNALGNETEVTSAHQVDSRRNSLSSTGSWIRRLSLRPLSQHGSSPRSSMVVDRQSVTLSHSSTAPILRPKSAAPNLPPNKLVKRSPSTHAHDSQQVSRSKSRGHLPTLRRPATSHQRTATLEQLRLNAQENQGFPLSGEPKYSFEQRPSTDSVFTGSNTTTSQTLSENTHWSSFFHSRRTTLAVDGRPSTGSPRSRANTVRRISAKAFSVCQNTVHLVKPKMVTSSSVPSLRRGPSTHLAPPAEIVPEQAEQEAHEEQKYTNQQALAAARQDEALSPTRAEDGRDDVTERPSSSMRMRRSLSTSFATVTGHLVAKTSGSIRRPKRGERQPVSAVSSVGRRHASAPISGSTAVLAGVEHETMGLKPPMASPKQGPQQPLPRTVSASAALDAPLQQKHQQQPQQAGQHAQQPQQVQQVQQRTRQPSRHHHHHQRPQQQHPQHPYGAATTTTTTSSSSFHGSHKRNLSSPLPPPPQRALNFQIDNSLPRAASFSPAFGPAGGVAAAATAVHSVRPLQPSTSSTASSALSTSHQRSPYYETSPVMEGFDSDARGFTSGDDDDTDFKSDTLYDSLRTVASSRARAVDTPLESVYDESPPSTASNGKARRLSIHEMLDKAWDADDRITEEDETSQTPVRAPATKVNAPTRHDAAHNGPSANDLRLAVNPIHSSFPTRDFGRMSLEDDFDDDWARYEDEADSHISPLSAPSKSSLNAKGMNPNVRLALANMSNGDEGSENAPHPERPLSNIFDWSEPSTQDKHDAERRSGRPQTAYGKQAVDPRGGRSANRRGPAPAHVRSQSVPVVHDAADEHKPTGAKYGTWGLGTKTVSEDWDEDFEFGSAADNDDRANESMFAVPESIRASQPSVKAHSGQIRELSLLVNDLKRLCRHGRDMGLLEGSQKALWKEAEGVIALASPDDETMDDDLDSNPSVDLDAFDGKAKQGDSRPKTPQTEPFHVGSPKLEPSISKTAVLRERHSPRRRSVFSPDDDIFGGAESSADKKAGSSKKPSQQPPQTPERLADVNGVVRTVMEAMQHRSHSDAILETGKPSRKVQFDTNSLKALVRRSGELRDALSDIIRRTDQLTQSPARPLRHDRDRGPDSSPAFTRVFDDPGSSPPHRGTTRSRGNTSLKQTTSPDSSPPPQMERRFPLMTVR
ncbi:hypothetical protein PWT90_05048 [Aphanocladium album]|nr:hypothetical protein PWT90_05048 [Aphanocladium album]